MGFHEFVQSGNEEALETFYKSKRQSPVLGRVQFSQSVRELASNLPKEIPRYERRSVQASPEHVIGKIAGIYKIPKEKVMRGVRGKENEARKVAMYLVRRCCDQTLSETARLFGLGRYKAIVCDKDIYLLSLVRYIHLNPIRAKMVRKPEEYPYSGHRNYMEGRVSAVLDGRVLDMLGGRTGYGRFVLEGLKGRAPGGLLPA